MAKLIDGRAIAHELEDEIRAEIEAMMAAGLPRPGLAVILVGDDEASAVYVDQKAKASQRVGICGTTHRLPADTPQNTLLELIDRLNAAPDVSGILCQVPLPDHIDTSLVQRAIAPEKDVDGFHPANFGSLFVGGGGIAACTPLGILKLLDTEFDSLVGQRTLVIGRSRIVGRPVAMMLVDRGCVVTIAHSRTRNLPRTAREADIIVAAAGVPELVKGSWVKGGAVIIDVGITRIGGEDGKERLVGDVAFDEVQHARSVTPVPGGVGPMTIACLLANTVQAARTLAGSGEARGFDYSDAPNCPMLPEVRART